MTLFRTLLLACCLLPSLAQALTLEDVLASSKRHYPKIIEAREKIEAQKGKIQKAQGAFDWELNHKQSHRLSGYYDGQYVESQISRRLSDSATRVYGGYRISDGDFPIYEQQYPTLNRGEVNAGMMISLWRDRIIDEERFAFSDAQLEMKQKETELLLTQTSVQYDAMTSYIDWVAAGLALKVAQAQLDLAEQRQKGFEERVAQGDLARIYLTENRQVILKRQAEVTETTRKLREAAVKLGLYLRDGEGAPMMPPDTALPTSLPDPGKLALEQLDREIERARSMRPDIISIHIDLERQRNALRLGENKTMPKVNLYIEGARDIGSGPISRQGNEAKIGLNISIPLQQNTGEGMIAQTKAEIRQIEQRKRLLNDQIASQIQSIANDYHAAHQYLILTEQEIVAASAMQDAEHIKFEQGAADYFVLNIREEKRAEAQLKNINAHAKLWEAVAGYYLTTLQLDKFQLK